jgi:hypothetical protein
MAYLSGHSRHERKAAYPLTVYRFKTADGSEINGSTLPRVRGPVNSTYRILAARGVKSRPGTENSPNTFESTME